MTEVYKLVCGHCDRTNIIPADTVSMILAAQPSAGAQAASIEVILDPTVEGAYRLGKFTPATLPMPPYHYQQTDLTGGSTISSATPAQPDTGDVAALREALEDIFGDGEEPELCNGNTNDLLAIQYWNTARKALAALSKPNAPRREG